MGIRPVRPELFHPPSLLERRMASPIPTTISARIRPGRSALVARGRDESSRSNGIDGQERQARAATRQPAGNPSRATEPQQPVDIKGWNVYVVDAHSLIFQVFHALPEMSSPRGEQVGAVFGFVRDMLYLIEEKKPDALICAFDLSGPTFRNELFDALQGRARRNAGRAGRPDSEDRASAGGAWRFRFSRAKASRPTTCWPRSPGSATKRARTAFIVTGDKDCRQLITDRVAVYNIRKNQVFDAAALRAGVGRRARPGRRFSGARGRQGRQRAGRARHRPEDGPDSCSKPTARSTICWSTPAKCRAPKGKKLVECRETGAAVARAGAAR